MLEAKVIRNPYTVVAAGGTIDDEVLEDALPVTELMDVKILFVNTHASQSIDLTIKRTIDLGTSMVPEDDGSFDVTEVTAEAIVAGAQYLYEPAIHHFMQFDASASQPIIQHKVSIAHSDSGDDDEDVIVQAFVVGKVESVTRNTIPNFEKAS